MENKNEETRKMLKNLSLLLMEVRTARNISQEQLGRIFNVSQAAIGTYERGTRVPSLEILVKYADYFGVSLDTLLGRTKEEIPTRKTVDISKLNRYDAVIYSGKELSQETIQSIKKVASEIVKISSKEN